MHGFRNLDLPTFTLLLALGSFAAGRMPASGMASAFSLLASSLALYLILEQALASELYRLINLLSAGAAAWMRSNLVYLYEIEGLLCSLQPIDDSSEQI